MKKIALIGGSGQLGTELQKIRKYDFAPSHQEFDLLNKPQMLNYLRVNKPDLLCLLAAYTDTQAPQINPEEAYKCFMVNVIGVRNLVDIASCPIIFISSESLIDPYNFYCITKLQGENEVKHGKQPYLIIRTSFRERPFEYDKACTDVWTIGDYVDVIAKEIDKLIANINGLFLWDKTIYVGTGPKTTYSLAKQTKPDIKAISRLELLNHIPSFEELLKV